MGKKDQIWVAVALIWACARLASAQSTTGTIAGRVTDVQSQVVPGVVVTFESPSLQGIRTAVTSTTGDYVQTLLPAGRYQVVFDLAGFGRQERTVTLATTQVLTVDATLGPAPVVETVSVSATPSVLVRTAQVATSIKQDLSASLPTTRDLNSALLLAPGVHPTGPNGFYSIAGSMSFENLFLVNGVTVNENLRGQAHDLYIEDAIQETTVATAGISAEYGRFGGGVVNVITKSGGNLFAGSLRNTLQNDDWRALTPFAGDSTVDKVLPTYEFTLGGPVQTDRLWFFVAGRAQNVDERRTLAVTNVPYDFSNRLRRFETKLTYSVRPSHHVEGTYIRSTEAQTNAAQSTLTAMDMRSLYDPHRGMDLTTVSYGAILSPALFVEARFSARNETLSDVGATATDLVNGTLLVDQQRGARRYWAPTFCGVCDAEERDNQDIFVKASYVVSAPRAGSHTLALGYDRFNDRRFANNHQSGSDYRILGTTSIVNGGDVTPVFMGDGTTIIQWNPIVVGSEGANIRMHSAFLNDNWRVSSRLTANLGVRYDRNQATNSAGAPVSNDSGVSPRLGLVFDPSGSHRWALSASYAQYVSALSGSIANSTSAGGNSEAYQFVYRGPSINPGGVLATETPAAVQQVFDWFFANGGPNLPLTGTPNIPGVTPQIRGSLDSPNVHEYASGVSREFGNRAAVRTDFVYRDYHDFYVSRTDMSTGKVTDKLGRTFDLTLVENTDQLKRRYAGLNTQLTLHAHDGIDVGATYTLSRAWGNVDGESATAGPTSDASLQYPEYKQASWNYPEGDLSIDQRHRGRIWANLAVPHVAGLYAGLIQILESGLPYGAVSTSGVNAQPFVVNPGYQTPPPGNQTVYYFTDRDAFRTEGQKRTDLAVNYTRRLPLGRLELFGQLQVINVFNQFQLCGCGSSVTQNGGAVVASRIDQTVRTSVTTPASYQTFNPFLTTPVQGVNWDYAPTFGTAVNRMAYTSPRAARVSFGVRF